MWGGDVRVGGWLCLQPWECGRAGAGSVAVAGLEKERRAQRGPREHGVVLCGGSLGALGEGECGQGAWGAHPGAHRRCGRAACPGECGESQGNDVPGELVGAGGALC